MASRQPRKPSIGLNSCSSRRAVCELVADRRPSPRRPRRSPRRRAAGTRAAADRAGGSSPAGRSMISNSSTKSPRCIGRSLASAARRPFSSSARIISRTARMRSLLEEHVLGAAEPDALGAELHARRARRAACRHWRAPSSLRTLSAQPIRVANSPDSAGSSIGTRAGEHLAGRAVDGDDVALLERHAAGRHASAPRSRRGASRRRRRRACPCRARPRRRARSCRRAW